jgi:hypothetical protein
MAEEPEVTPDPPSGGLLDPFELGARLQGVVIGVPLFLALLKLMSLTESGGLFRYQGF